LETKQYNYVIQAATVALNIEPNNFKALKRRAIALRETESYIDSQKDFENALENAPHEERKSILTEFAKLKKRSQSQERDSQDKQLYQSIFNKDNKARYSGIVSQIQNSISGESNLIIIKATIVAILHEELNIIKNNQITRTVIYIVQPNGDLLLGPFQGKPATQRILKGTGIFGTAFKKRDCIISDSKGAPENFPKSEIVVPIFVKGKPTAALYIDSTSLPGVFNETDRDVLIQVGKLLQGCNWSPPAQLVSSRLTNFNQFLVFTIVPTLGMFILYFFRSSIKKLVYL